MKLSIIFVIAFIFVQCDVPESGNPDENQRVRTVAVETVTMEEDTLEEMIRLNGTVEAFDDATISSEASGRIQNIVPLGTQLDEGDVIAGMDDRLLQAQYEASRASYELAVDTYNRQQALYADSIISELEYNTIRTQRDQAAAQLEQAQKQLLDAQIEAPFPGRVEERFVKAGELINPGMPVARIVNTSRVNITAGVPERYAADVREGTRVVISFRAYGDMNREATITFAGNVVDSETRTFPIEIEFPNPDRTVKPEMVAELQIQRRTIENTFVVPRTALVRDEYGPNVFISRTENDYPVAKFVPVETGAVSGALVEIVDGLQAGDEVVVSGQRNLNPGDRLEILDTKGSVEYILAIRNRSTGR